MNFGIEIGDGYWQYNIVQKWHNSSVCVKWELNRITEQNLLEPWLHIIDQVCQLLFSFARFERLVEQENGGHEVKKRWKYGDIEGPVQVVVVGVHQPRPVGMHYTEDEPTDEQWNSLSKIDKLDINVWHVANETHWLTPPEGMLIRLLRPHIDWRNA